MDSDSDLAKPTDVYIRAGYTKVYDIDTINQRFQAEFIVESKWHDPTLRSVNDNILWKPDLYIENALNNLKEEITYKIFGTITYLK